MRTLRQDGIAKALAGVTTLEEVLRVDPEVGLRIGELRIVNCRSELTKVE